MIQTNYTINLWHLQQIMTYFFVFCTFRQEKRCKSLHLYLSLVNLMTLYFMFYFFFLLLEALSFMIVSTISSTLSMSFSRGSFISDFLYLVLVFFFLFTMVVIILVMNRTRMITLITVPTTMR